MRHERGAGEERTVEVVEEEGIEPRLLPLPAPGSAAARESDAVPGAVGEPPTVRAPDTERTAASGRRERNPGSSMGGSGAPGAGAGAAAPHPPSPAAPAKRQPFVFEPLRPYRGLLRRYFVVIRHVLGLLAGGAVAYARALPPERKRGLRSARASSPSSCAPSWTGGSAVSPFRSSSGAGSRSSDQPT